MTAAAEVTVKLCRPAAVALLELATKHGAELPRDLAVPIRAALLAAMHLAPSEPVR